MGRPKRIKYYSPKRRAIYARGEQFYAVEIFDRDGWVCQLCFTRVSRRLRFPSWWCATLDHIVPLSKGGEHTRDNVQLAHLKCNQDKGDEISLQEAIEHDLRA